MSQSFIIRYIRIKEAVDVAREADFIIDCSSYSDNITKVIEALNKIGWSYSNNHMEYLPLHDNDSFDWQKEPLSVEKLFEVISSKQDFGELCGVVLYHHFSDKGITILARDTKEVMVNININRKTMYGGFTDISWYIENIVTKLYEIGCIVESVRYTEVIG